MRFSLCRPLAGGRLLHGAAGRRGRMFLGHTAGNPRPITGRRPSCVCATMGRMEIRSGTIAALYLFDVAEQIDLAALRGALGGGADARIASKSAQPAYLNYQVPPLVLEGEAARVP